MIDDSSSSFHITRGGNDSSRFEWAKVCQNVLNDQVISLYDKFVRQLLLDRAKVINGIN